jgi:catechol 2,3-dioxygenase-like lactoylglutathione lyase family enzyme
MIVGIHHLGLVVPNFERAIAFYEAAFGLEERLRFPIENRPDTQAMLALPSVQGKAALLAAPNMLLEIFEFAGASSAEENRPVNKAGIGHFCVQGAEAGEFAGRFREAGGRFHAPQTDLGGTILYAYPRDGDGNVVELESIPEAKSEPGQWIGHVSIATPDLDRAVRFYEQLSGATARRSSRLGPNPKIDLLTGLRNVEVTGAWLDLGNAQLELWQYHEPATTPATLPTQANDIGYTHIAFEVDDVFAERSRLSELNVAFQGEPIRRNGVDATYGRDPDGNMFELISFHGPGTRLSLKSLKDIDIVPRVEAALRQARGS